MIAVLGIGPQFTSQEIAMNRMFPLALALALAPFAVHSHAAQVEQKPLVAQTLDAFTGDSARIEQQMQPGGLYDHISSSEKARVDERLKEMHNLLAAHANAADMPEQDKIALANAQEEINGILSHNDNNRLICEHVAPVGSHRPITTCRTYGEIMARHERMEHDLTKQLSTPQLRGGD
jgi:coenzyme F420-reducing hydrogenase alpha subunit